MERLEESPVRPVLEGFFVMVKGKCYLCFPRMLGVRESSEAEVLAI